ncbi:putative 7-deoxyloganetin glucosyltransferase [Dioscorea sansibarensis]
MDTQIQAQAEKPHAVCIPFPAQGHIAPMLHLANLIHSNGFHITFVNTHYNHSRLLSSQGPAALLAAYDFNFTTIPDGLLFFVLPFPPLVSLLCFISFTNLIRTNLLVYYIVSSCIMTFSVDAANELGIPVLVLWTPSACGLMCYLHFHQILQDGLISSQIFRINLLVYILLTLM